MKKYTHELIVIEIIRRLNSLSEISGCKALVANCLETRDIIYD